MAKKISKKIQSRFTKDIRRQVEAKLGSIVESLSAEAGGKKLKKRIRRAGKLLVKGIKPPTLIKEEKPAVTG